MNDRSPATKLLFDNLKPSSYLYQPIPAAHKGYFMVFPQSMQDRNSLRLFEQWLLTQIAQR